MELGDVDESVDGDTDGVLDPKIDGLSVSKEVGKVEGFADDRMDEGWCDKDGDSEDKIIGSDVGDTVESLASSEGG